MSLIFILILREGQLDGISPDSLLPQDYISVPLFRKMTWQGIIVLVDNFVFKMSLLCCFFSIKNISWFPTTPHCPSQWFLGTWWAVDHHIHTSFFLWRKISLTMALDIVFISIWTLCFFFQSLIFIIYILKFSPII